VVSKNYLNIWNIQSNQLIVIPMSTIEKIQNDGGKNTGKSEKDK